MNEVRTTQPKLAQSAKNHSGSGPRAKDIGFSKDMAPTITSIESLTRKVKDQADFMKRGVGGQNVGDFVCIIATP